jgi:predicted enzyme related to lactoylglutathione lyase
MFISRKCFSDKLKPMNKNIKLIVYTVTNLKSSKELFNTFLGTEPYADSPYYVGYKVGDLEVGLTIAMPNQSAASPVAYVDVTDINDSLEMLKKVGSTLLQEPKDVGGGLLVASIKDENDNVLGLRQTR